MQSETIYKTTMNETYLTIVNSLLKVKMGGRGAIRQSSFLKSPNCWIVGIYICVTKCKIKQHFSTSVRAVSYFDWAWVFCSGPDWGNLTLAWQGQSFKVRNVTPVECQFDTSFFFLFFFFQIAQDTVTQTWNKSGLQLSHFKAAASSSLSGADCNAACGKEGQIHTRGGPLDSFEIEWQLKITFQTYWQAFRGFSSYYFSFFVCVCVF